MNIDESIETTIVNCFSQYKNSVFKIGLDEAHVSLDSYFSIRSLSDQYTYILELLIPT